MHGESISYGYAFWSLVVVNVAIFEREAEGAFGDAYRAYKARTPMFVPRFLARRVAEPRWSER